MKFKEKERQAPNIVFIANSILCKFAKIICIVLVVAQKGFGWSKLHCDGYRGVWEPRGFWATIENATKFASFCVAKDKIAEIILF